MGSRTGTSITSSSSNILWRGDVFRLDALTSGFTNILNTTGTVTIEPSATSFSSAVTYPITNFTIAGTVSGLTIGKPGNTANLTIGSALSIAGPIDLYAGTLTLNGNLTSTSSGDISLYSDAALAGLSSARTITTSGAFKYIPQSTSFSSAVTFPITNLTLTNVNGVQIGKSGNTAGVTIGSAASVNGYFTAFGGAIALNNSITTSNMTTGNIALTGTTVSGTGNLVLAAGRTATINVSSASTYDGIISGGTGSGFTKQGAGLLTLTKDHTYTGTTTISAGNLQVGSGGTVDQASSGTLASASAVSVASGSRLILAPNENINFGNAVSGAGGLEIKGMSGRYYNAFLTGTAATIVANTSVLEVLTRITGGVMGGAGASGACGAYRKSYHAGTNVGTLQFQQYMSTGDVTNVVYVTLESISTTNVSIRATGAASKTGNVLGQDITTLSPTAQTLATTSGGAGFGISQVFMSGKINFTGTLTYGGATTLSNNLTSGTNPTYSYTSRGTQEISDASASFPSGSPVVNDALIILNRSTPLTISNDLSGTEELLQVGAEITMTGTNTYSGATTIDLNKSLKIGSGGTSGSITGAIINYGSLEFNRSDASTYANVVSGTGTLTKSGAGALTMTGLNTYTGATTINAGSLILERNVPATSSSGFSGSGTLVIQPSSTSFTSPFSFSNTGFKVNNAIGGLTLGKAGNTQTITFNGATQAAGPLTVYGTVAIGADLTTTNAGDISIISDASLSATGGSWTANAAGMFKYMPNGTSFSGPVSYPIGNLTVTSNGLQLGKSGNTAGITIATATTSNGPVTVFSGDFTTSGTLTANSNVLEVNASGNVSLDAALIGSTTTVNGQGNVKTTGTLTNLNLSGGNAQIITGTATLTNLTLNKSVGTIATINAGPQNLTGTLNLDGGILAAGGNLTLKSSSSGTARVAQHGTGTGTVTGDVVVERWVNSATGNRIRQWRMLGFPYSTAVTLSGIGGMSIDYAANTRSMMYFNESGADASTGNSGPRNAGYQSFTSSGQQITAGQGVMAWLFGNSGGTASSGTLAADLTITSSGALNESGNDVVIPLSYTAENANAGWNLLANPYASSIDWNSVTRTASVQNTVYRWNPASASWTTFNNTTEGNTGGADNIIESGAAFFVRTSAASQSLTIPQSAKTSTATELPHHGRAPFRLDLPSERMDANRKRLAGLRVKVSGQGNPLPDDIYIDVSRADATAGYDRHYDAESMGRTSGAGVSVKDSDGTSYAMQFDAPIKEAGSEKRFYNLKVTSPAVGRTTLEIASEGDWSPLNSVSLIDNKEGKTILMQGGMLSHSFNMNSLKEEGRFILAINHVAVDKSGGADGKHIRLLGNPVTTEKIDLLLAHPTARPRRWELSSMQGAKVAEGRFDVTDGNVQYGLDTKGMRASGIYVLRVELDNGEVQTVQVMRK